MKLVKSLLLGSTAAMAAAAGAQAADLPSRKAAPVEYVKICDAYGAGFFYIPGTDTCIRIGGYVRAEYDYTPGQAVISEGAQAATAVVGGVNAGGGGITQVGAAQDQTGIEVRGRIDLDARTQTTYGTVQTVIHLRAANTDGIRTTPATTNFLTAYTPAGNSTSALTMERAYIRFAGFTAGVADENATTMPSYMYSSNVYAGFPNGIKQLTYTATFGGGFSATIAIESQGDFGYIAPGASKPPAPSVVVTNDPSVYNNHWDTGYELVGNVRYDASWGYIQLAGLVGNDSAGCATSAASPTGQVCSSTYNPLLGPTKYGQFGLMGSFGVKLPMIAPGDEFHAQVGYGNGFLGAVESQGGFNDLSDASNKRVLGGVIRADSNIVPTVVNAAGTSVDAFGLTTAWGVYGIFTHYWTPNWRSNVASGYYSVTPPTANCTYTIGAVTTTTTGAACTVNATTGLNTQWGHGYVFQLAGNLIWSPTKNFDIGFEVEYLRINSTIQNPNAAFVAAGSPGLSENGLIYHLRLERTF